MILTVAEVEWLAREAHEGQVDKIGVPYFQHVRAVADGLAPFGPALEMAGLLHDILEDTPWTAFELIQAGVPEAVVRTVEGVTNRPGERYQDKMERISRDPLACLVKLADNAHNSRADRAEHLEDAVRERLRVKYAKAREVLLSGVPVEYARTVWGIVNPDLLAV